MAQKNLSLTFSGYWREPNRGGVPAASGVYCVYTATHNEAANTVTLHKLVYIGEAGDVRQRLANHERRGDWARHLGRGQVLCFSFAPVAAADRAQCEAALINRHKPPENTEYVDSFPFDPTTITVAGKTNLLQSGFTVANPLRSLWR